MLGKIIKEIREDRGISQTDLYDGLISKRQAIRFEQDEADVKGIVLVGIMNRLGLTRDELDLRIQQDSKKKNTPWSEFALLRKSPVGGQNPKAMSFYSKYRFSKNKQTERLAVLASLLVDDEPLDERDVNFFIDELVAARTLTTEQIISFLDNIDRFPMIEKEDILLKVWDSIQMYQKLSYFPEMIGKFGDASLKFYLLEKPNLTKAKHWFNELKKVEQVLNKADKISYNSWELLISLASKDSADTHDQLSKRAQILLLLGLAEDADLLIDARRQIEVNMNLNHKWSKGEIGSVARRVNKMPKGSTVSAQDYLASFPGLLDAVRENGKPFSSYLNNYEY